MLAKLWRQLVFVPRIPFLGIILIYQHTLSPDHGPLATLFPNGYCKYYPTCSRYGYQAIERYGLFRGLLLAGFRILRCNPASAGGIDPVPHHFTFKLKHPSHAL